MLRTACNGPKVIISTALASGPTLPTSQNMNITYNIGQGIAYKYYKDERFGSSPKIIMKTSSAKSTLASMVSTPHTQCQVTNLLYNNHVPVMIT